MSSSVGVHHRVYLAFVILNFKKSYQGTCLKLRGTRPAAQVLLDLLRIPAMSPELLFYCIFVIRKPRMFTELCQFNVTVGRVALWGNGSQVQYGIFPVEAGFKACSSFPYVVVFCGMSLGHVPQHTCSLGPVVYNRRCSGPFFSLSPPLSPGTSYYVVRRQHFESCTLLPFLFLDMGPKDSCSEPSSFPEAGIHLSLF